MSTQAARIISKFGGARNLYRALLLLGDTNVVRTPATIYKWTYPRSKGGTDGLIPTSAIQPVKQAARHIGIFLTMEEWQP